MPPKKVYAVAKGRKPGIYYNWPAAKSQIDGFTGAVYKGFPTVQEAEEWMKDPVYNRSSGPSDIKQDQPDDITLKYDEVTIYTDGGSSGNPGPGGYGVVQLYKDHRKELTGGFRLTTNNRMELMGVIEALKNLEHRNVPVTVYTDSSYVINGINKGWAKKWKKNNWIKSDKKPAINPDQWNELLDLIEPLNITFRWVKGHAGNTFNERCDELAVSSARGKNLPVDKGYKE
jgi:ribonuclease HI